MSLRGQDKKTEFIPGTQKRRCQEHVVRYEGLADFSGQCDRPAKRGMDYCAVHDPEAKRRRAQKARAQYDAKKIKWQQEFFALKFLVALERIEAGHNDPRAVAKDVLAEYRKGLPEPEQ